MITLLLVALLSRPYHNETIQSLPHSTETHVRVTGRVTMVRCEDDGDWHIRLTDGGTAFIVAEVIPLIPMTAVKRGTPCQQQTRKPVAVGATLTVEGVRRFDDAPGHGWAEIHPVERWTVNR